MYVWMCVAAAPEMSDESFDVVEIDGWGSGGVLEVLGDIPEGEESFPEVG